MNIKNSIKSSEEEKNLGDLCKRDGPSEPKMPVVAYTYGVESGAKDSVSTIAGQLREIWQYCALNSLSIVTEYCDRKDSGDFKTHPAWLRLIEDASREPQKFQAVVVCSRSRFGRDLTENQLRIDSLKRRGIRWCCTAFGFELRSDEEIFRNWNKAFADNECKAAGIPIYRCPAKNAQ
jgi:DNA invertase Pin-like site-specific DNA recombinase